MSEFNSMTIVAAAETISQSKSHADIDLLAVEWEISEKCSLSSKPARAACLAKIAIEEKIDVMTMNGRVPLGQALIETAIRLPIKNENRDARRKLIAGLRFDGFEVVETEIEVERHPWEDGATKKTVTLVRMLPDDIPGLDFREAESEIIVLLDRSGFTIAKGHLTQALSAFQRGEWAASNSQLRTFYQELLDKIAENLGCEASKSDDAKRKFLADVASGPFLIHEYNEWENDRGRPAFILGLWARLHPQGSHPGLSDEDDAAFRLQITLITARLLMRRFDKRK